MSLIVTLLLKLKSTRVLLDDDKVREDLINSMKIRGETASFADFCVSATTVNNEQGDSKQSTNDMKGHTGEALFVLNILPDIIPNVHSPLSVVKACYKV